MFGKLKKKCKVTHHLFTKKAYKNVYVLMMSWSSSNHYHRRHKGLYNFLLSWREIIFWIDDMWNIYFDTISLPLLKLFTFFTTKQLCIYGTNNKMLKWVVFQKPQEFRKRVVVSQFSVDYILYSHFSRSTILRYEDIFSLVFIPMFTHKNVCNLFDIWYWTFWKYFVLKICSWNQLYILKIAADCRNMSLLLNTIIYFKRIIFFKFAF